MVLMTYRKLYTVQAEGSAWAIVNPKGWVVMRRESQGDAKSIARHLNEKILGV